jgi:mono/diheme cytochrome c family protein
LFLPPPTSRSPTAGAAGVSVDPIAEIMQRRAIRVAMLLAAAAIALGAAAALWMTVKREPRGPADPRDAALVEIGARIYAEHCASCHGADLEGEPDWQTPRPDDRMPAPPHDESGHTWHHSDELLFGITRDGMLPYVRAPYESNMPAYGNILTDGEIWAVLAYIKSRWPEKALRYQQAITARSRE